jgi:hypothetical protein
MIGEGVQELQNLRGTQFGKSISWGELDYEGVG